jgi:hypothetical protein
MLNLILTEDDQDWLSEKYPGLTITNESGVMVITGIFSFYAAYDGQEITDEYEVRIDLKAGPLSDLPRVRETKSRIKRLAAERNIDLSDLHTYIDGTACLCVKPAEKIYFPDKFCFQRFIQELVVPFFFAQSFFEKNGSWPWETYGHGSLGWLEWYFDQGVVAPSVTSEYLENLHLEHDWKRIRRALTRKGGVKDYRACLCGSTKSFRNCHQKAFHGLRQLYFHFKTLGIKP